ncbi:MAG: GHMP kinase [Chloroflexota bacterium]
MQTFMIGQAALPATCGELVQGTLDGVPCLVSCPIDRYNFVEIRLEAGPEWDLPKDATKSIIALQSGLAYLHAKHQGGQMHLLSTLPRGQGYGSSTADVGATLYALSLALQKPLSALEVSQLAVAIEPTDSTIFPGISLFDHRQGTFQEQLGTAPPLKILVINPGGVVDTLAFNRQNDPVKLQQFAGQHREAFEMLRLGFSDNDWSLIGEAATLSSSVHDKILPNPLLEPVLQISRAVGALGVCRAHSGTLLGILFNPKQADENTITPYVYKRLGTGINLKLHALVDGGPFPNPLSTINFQAAEVETGII